jgi:hypothetical protein
MNSITDEIRLFFASCKRQIRRTFKRQETFQLQLQDLPEAAQDMVAQETRPYTVVIIINDEQIGSGTLVKIGSSHGVLTAEHVVRHPKRPDLHLDSTNPNGPRLLLPPADFPDGIPIESFALRVFTTKRPSGSHSPDLAFVVLPPSPLLNELMLRKSFYPLAVSPINSMSNALDEIGYVAFCGFPGALQEKHQPSHGYSSVIKAQGFAFITGPDRYYRSNGWDYYELGFTPKEIPEIETFGGVSGGGVWRIPIFRKQGDKPGQEQIGKPTLAGVAFYEDWNPAKARFFVTTHGPRSIYSKFLRELQVALK